jgi:hypothetical protein
LSPGNKADDNQHRNRRIGHHMDEGSTQIVVATKAGI